MKQFYKNIYLFLILGLFLSLTITAQKSENFWIKTTKENVSASKQILRNSQPTKSKFYQLDINGLKNMLQNAPKRNGFNAVSNVIVSFPTEKGNFESFRIKEASTMSLELQAKFPEIRSFVGKGIDNPTAIIRFSLSPEKGLSSMVLSDKKTVFIEPYTNDLSTYIVYINSISDKNNSTFECETEYVKNKINFDSVVALNANDGQLRTFRLALACTGEYAAFHGGTQAGALAAMNTTMTRVNGVFERDVALTMVMVDNTSIIFLDGATDPYTNSSGPAMLGENQTTCDTNIGSANYDIGHVFSTGGGGVAYLNSPCGGSKAGGVTGQGSPIGDTFDIDYVAHEMGHQYGANHTQNNDCNRTAVSVEPGSASTIMGYAGICAPNVQNNSDDYFHGESIKEMWANISAGASQCATQSATGNSAPIAIAGADYSIPKSTPFILKGDATDVDAGNSLTYCWEQIDTTPATMPPVSTSTVGPAFRSLQPKVSPDRYMPDFATVLGGATASTWEVVPSVGRTMNFSLTVRDNVSGGASSDSDNMIVTVEDVVPFTVSTPPTWGQGSTQTVSWVVGQTTNGTINCQNVNILFSSDGGANFSTTLASNTPNDGSQQITVPTIPDTNNAIILVEAADNIFYTISSVFSVSNTPDFSFNNTNGDQSACNIDSVSYNFDYLTSNGFSETTTFSATGNPAGSNVVFTPANLNSDGSFTMDVNGLTGAAVGDYTITVTGTSASITKNVDVVLTVIDGLCTSVGDETDTYLTSTTGVIFNTISNLNNNPGGDNGYSDFTAISTDVNRESIYNLTVNVNTDGNWLCTTRVWIDWNQNCSFNDAGEEYNLGDVTNVTNDPTGNSPLAITIPADALLGNTIMRVSTKYSSAPTSCENGADAEVEDYTVNVFASLSVGENVFDNFIIYPNPNNGEFTIKLNSNSSDTIKINVYDIRGRRVFDNLYKNNSNFNEVINLGNVQSGIYLLNVSDGIRSTTKKIVIQ
ncbi:MAG: M12 family metallo-peptidase [Flavobacteriaceae bacterium]|nr:M12 family metallo-peptidase [Flavobacteriaceae bacterium]